MCKVLKLSIKILLHYSLDLPVVKITTYAMYKPMTKHYVNSKIRINKKTP